MKLNWMILLLALLKSATVDADCPKCARFGYCDPTTSTCKCRAGFIGDGQDCGKKCGTKTCSSDATCSIDSVFGKMSRNCKCVEGFSGNGEICTSIPDVTTTEPTATAVRIPCPDKDHLCSLDAECATISIFPLKIQCVCKDGFTGGGITCTDIDECTSNPCKDNSKCINTKGGYRCECMAGFTNDGPYKCKDIDECKTSPCKGSNSRCENTEGSHICHCTDGYVSDGADGCKDPRTPCPDKDNLCSVDALCSPISFVPLKFQCACKNGFSGDGITCTDIDECISNPCKYNSKCINTKGGYRCECMSGFTNDGPDTCKDIDECKTSPCKGNNSRCENTEGSHICHCVDGYVSDGANGCKDPRTPCPDKDNLCSADALCSSISFVPLKFQCACKYGFSGDGITCTDIDECTSNPCRDNSTCINARGDYSCECMSGFINDGPYKCKAGIPCMDHSLVCSIDAFCGFDKLRMRFYCSCKPGFTGNGQTCTDMNECSAVVSPCRGENSKCYNTDGSFTCQCPVGYTGDGISSCTDTDECKTSPCKGNNSRCENTEGSYICHCTAGYVSDGADGCKAGIPCVDDSLTCSIDAHCGFDRYRRMFYCFCKSGFTGSGQVCSDIDECATGEAKCNRNADCTNTVGSYRCGCKLNYFGDGFTCEDKRKPCPDESYKCSENAHCVLDDKYECLCKRGFTGDGLTCTDVDECALKTDNCAENAICFNTVGSFSCACKLNFAGDGVTCI